MKRLLTAVSLAALWSMPAIVIAQQMMSGPDHITIPLKAENGSGESGTATLTQKGSDVEVVVHIKDALAPTQPMHIHPGTCATLDPKPKYPLTLVKDGESVSTVKDVQLSALLASPFAINVHKSTNDIATYVACGDIKTT